MGILSHDVAIDHAKRRLVLLLYGKPKVGKTTTILNLASPEKKQYVILLDVDRGARMERDKQPERYQGRLTIGETVSMREIRAGIAEAYEEVKALMLPKEQGGKGYPARRIWTVLDSGTILQQNLLVEARKIDIAQTRAKQHTVTTDSFEREMVTGVDYLANLGHMGEVMNSLMGLPCNVVVVAHEKGSKEGLKSDKTIYKPDFSGAIYNMVCGRCDVIVRMMQTSDGKDRVFRAKNNSEDESGDRSGKLDEYEPADLLALHRKIFPLPPKAQAGNSQGELPAEAK